MDKLEELKIEMAELRKQREQLSARISDLWYQINYLEKLRPLHAERKVEETLAYQMFGKPYCELNKEERRVYNYEARQRHKAKKAEGN